MLLLLRNPSGDGRFIDTKTPARAKPGGRRRQADIVSYRTLSTFPAMAWRPARQIGNTSDNSEPRVDFAPGKENVCSDEDSI